MDHNQSSVIDELERWSHKQLVIPRCKGMHVY